MTPTKQDKELNYGGKPMTPKLNIGGEINATINSNN